jgi:hypothetical protein
VQASGAINGRDFEAVVKSIVDARQSGLLTLFDELNIPIAYLQFVSGNIERVYFQGIVGEMAFAELTYRLPAKGFSFRPNENFAWGELRKIEMPAQTLLTESLKRSQELPAMLDYVGSEARYQRVVKDFKAQGFNENVQWLVNNIWQSIDGYLTVNQLSERVGADTYTIVQGLRELINQGVISLINRQSPFGMNGQLGTPIVSHTDFDINPGDSLKAFYLDPLSGAPCWQDGDFAGVASVLQPKNLLHSIPIRLKVPGALVLKNYKLIGVHNGTVPLKPGQAPMERQLYQMMWIGALFDMSSKKLRAGDTGEDTTTTSSGTRHLALRELHEEEEKSPTVEKLAAYICPSCFANNTKIGNCFNCGAPIEARAVGEVKKPGFFNTTMRIQAINDIQEKYQLSDKQVFTAIGGAALVLLLLIIFIACGNSTSTAPPQVSTNKVENKDAAQSVKLATSVVGFKGTAPPGYWFADTSALTDPLPSFGLFSESANQKIVFVIFNDLSPIHALDRFTQIPPFSDVVPSVSDELFAQKAKEGSQILGDTSFHYFVREYNTSNHSSKTMLIGSFPAKESGKGVLVLGQTLKEGIYDFKSTLFVIDNMSESLTAAANSKLQQSLGNTPKPSHSADEGKNKSASKEEVDKYCQNLQEQLQKSLSDESDLLEQVKKQQGKLKVVLEVAIDDSGNLTKMEIAEPDPRQKTNDDLVKVVNSLTPLKNVPKVDDYPLNLRIIFKNGKIKVQSSN